MLGSHASNRLSFAAHSLKIRVITNKVNGAWLRVITPKLVAPVRVGGVWFGALLERTMARLVSRAGAWLMGSQRQAQDGPQAVSAQGRATGTGAKVCQRDVATVALCISAGNGQAQPGPVPTFTLVGFGVVVCLVAGVGADVMKAFESIFPLTQGNARAVVQHLSQRHASPGADHHGDVSARWCVGTGVVHQIGQRFVQLGAHSPHRKHG